jgi:hypothetical protein
MANPASLFQIPEASPTASTVSHPLGELNDDGEQFLELRTENGAIYLRPSRWQRIRLQWIFRHFHVLSPQVLSRADRRLIRKLSRSAVVTPALPVPSHAILGVIEKACAKPPVFANRVVTMRPAAAAKQAFVAKPEIPALPSPVLSLNLKRTETSSFFDFPFQQWRDLGALAAVGLVVILVSVYRAPLVSSAVKMWNPRPAIEHAAKLPVLPSPALNPVLVSPTAVWLAKAEKPRPSIAPWIAAPPRKPALAAAAPLPGASPLDTTPESAPASTRQFVAELPPGYFAHPFVSASNPVGELQLKALIGADGSVEDVTVLSGSPELAKAGVRAVRQWHYSPYRVQGNPVEVETQIKMSFFGPDAVSIASVANGK